MHPSAYSRATTVAAAENTNWLSIFFQSYIVTLLGTWIWTGAIAHHGLANVAPLSWLVPLSVLAFGSVIYDETLSAIDLLGVGFVIGGLVAVSWRVKASIRRQDT